MGRIVALDYGGKRCGLAMTDPLGMFAVGLDTVPTELLIKEIKRLDDTHQIEKLIIGLPLRMSGELSAIEEQIQRTISNISKAIESLPIERLDERFTSKLAMQTMIEAGASKKQRRNKETIDKISATLLLQEYLNSR
ncbi:MAG: Holliday junction resolvase RuvX [Salibacteraceae bacterium]